MGVISCWRISRNLYRRRLKILARLFKLFNFMFFHAVLPYEAIVGDGVKLEHSGLGVVIHPNVTIGNNVCIYQHVTIAAETWIGSPHRVIIEDDVMIGAGAAIIARTDQTLRIGKGARIGANAVVTRDVDSGQTVVGVPARPVFSSRSQTDPLRPETEPDPLSVVH